MREAYRVQMMTVADYSIYMSGANGGYDVKSVDVFAESIEEAVAIVKAANPGMMINGYVRTVREIEAEEAERKARFEAEEAKAKAKADKRKANEEKKAAEMGMPVTEYRSYKNRQRKVREYEKRIAEYEAEITRMREYIEKYKIDG